VSEPSKIDGAIVQWGERLFYPYNRIVKVASQPQAGCFAGAASCQDQVPDRGDRRSPRAPGHGQGDRGCRALAALALGVKRREAALERLRPSHQTRV